ncbi:ABC transporter permease [Paenibacillus endoradicis]|uniref:ABC transporter permease n=1 Tax=Paenibacillus endoradicis TaxID=2972487 RepID=UPI002158DA7B|nr:ABC transporter permease [Paenibacillus endoradicis]MCR8655962.1 ABC transporter permease [Paenibacillus endoradicis]MCR8658288.1 ABC transporter permease [Paenibacillus endoradicis]
MPKRLIRINDSVIVPTSTPIINKRTVSPKWKRVWIDDRTVLAGSIIVVLAIYVSIFATILAPYAPNVGDNSLRLALPGTSGHWLGLDQQGRDIWSRLMYGGRMSLMTAIIPIVIAALLSGTIGLIAGFMKGKIGEIIMRFMDILFAFPTILLALTITTLLEVGIRSVIITLTIALIPNMTRIVYTAVIAESGKEYIEAAKVLGASKFELIFTELLPNVVTSLIVYATSLVGKMIIFSAGLSFMGLGIQAPQSDWGKMTSDGMAVILQGSYHAATIPGLVILIVSIGFNWLGDGLRNHFDPHY